MESLGEVRLSPMRSKSTRVSPKASRKTLQGDHGRDRRVDDLVARQESPNEQTKQWRFWGPHNADVGYLPGPREDCPTLMARHTSCLRTLPLLYGHAFGEIARLIDVAT